ncbi:FHA domain-containing protein [Nocardioides sp. W7]|uniref:FHA domain-containing protein n=1 Tax=Nocardioides sp. W7 TaxID=2931390 RepID=UPI001FD39827|nr:FHA domain-containing protein [Nocardioides sp. W7]
MAYHRCAGEVTGAEIFCPHCSTPILEGDLSDLPPGSEPDEATEPVPTSVVEAAPEPDPDRGPVGAHVPCPTCGSVEAAVPRACSFCGAEVAADVDTEVTRPPAAGAVVVELPGGASVTLTGESLELGRASPDPRVADALAAYDNVSRRHAHVRSDGTGVEIEDLGASNGTYVDGERLAPHQPRRLTGSFVVRLGSNVHLTVRVTP